MRWTEQDPGAGDLAGLENYVVWATSQAEMWSGAADQINRAQGGLPQFWSGSAADSCQAVLSAHRKVFQENVETFDIATAAIKTYIAEVEEIKNEARKAIEDREEALLAMNETFMASATSPPPDYEA